MQLVDKRILVSGSAGVIGRVLVRRLVQSRANVLGVDIAPDLHRTEGTRSLTADLAKGAPQAVIAFEPEVVFHLAATFERTVETAGYWKTVFENDVLASHRLIEAVEAVPSVKVFVFASSYLNYDPNLYLDVPRLRLLKESDTLLPRNMVGLSKYYIDRELDFLRNTGGGFRSVSARIFRVYGRGSRDVISRWIRAALDGEILTVFGSENHFDFIFADDVAEGLARLAEADDSSGAVNLGSGVSRSIAEVVDILKSQISGTTSRIESYRGPIESSCAEMSLFRQLTQWTPPTTLEAGIREIVSYERQKRAIATSAMMRTS